MSDLTLPVAAILAGGLATRLRPITEKIPKALVEVADQPFIIHQLNLFQQKGIKRVVICAGYLGEQIVEVVGNGQWLGLEVAYSFDGPTLLGTGGALKRAAPLLENEFLVFYGDSYLDCDYQAVYKAFRQSHKTGLMTVFKNEGRWDTSNVVFANGRIQVYDKKNLTPDMNYLDYGLGVLTQNALDQIPVDQPYDLMLLYQSLLKQNNLAGYQVTRRFYEIGSSEGLAETDAYLRKRLNITGHKK